ncbi:MAG TPA: carboxypeptidase-like regulatory domain-containing protein [Candidatus Acidoferrum sp.]|nr:carboxypeptidase-like regulatory domain-containing protein [Candidatus Acidoferrum sp.]
MVPKIVSRYRVLILLFLSPLGLRVAVAAQASTPSRTEKASIQGLVTTAPSSEPLKGVSVLLTRTREYGTFYRGVSDGTGQFSIQNIEPGNYQIRIEKEGYQSPDRVCSSSDIQDEDVIPLAAGQILSGLKFRMLATAVITGHVFDSSGDPITGAQVGAYLITALDGHRVLAARAHAITDDRGQYRLFHLRPGQYFLRLNDAFRLREELEEQTGADSAKVPGFRPIYYPDTFELDRAIQLVVHAGQEVSGINFTAHFAEVLRVRGEVVSGLTDDHVADGSLAIASLDAAMRENGGASYSIGEDGHFEISDLTPGRYLLSVLAQKLPDRRVWHGQREIELKDSSLNVLVRAFPGHDLSGRIEVQQGNKIDFTHLQVVLEPHTDVNYGEADAKVNADGTFLIPDVEQDLFDVVVAGLPSSYYLKSVTLGDADVTGGRLRIGNAPEAAPLILKIAKPAAEVTGKVQTADGKHACSARVVLIPDSREQVPMARSVEDLADQFGNYSLKGIVPGDYRLFAWDQNSSVPYLERGSLEPFGSQGHPIHLNEGDRLTVPLKLIAVQR